MFCAALVLVNAVVNPDEIDPFPVATPTKMLVQMLCNATKYAYLSAYLVFY